MTLAEALSIAVSPSGEARWEVPDGWQQGRGAFGGLTLAALAGAGAASLGARDRALRTITAEIASAVTVGPARLRATTLRAGNALSTVAVQLEQRDGAEVAAHAVLNFGRTRDVGFDRAEPVAPFPAFDDAPMRRFDPGPVFAQHLELRIVHGVPLTGDPQAVTEGWVRLREPGDVDPTLALLVMIDAWYPSVLPVMEAWRPLRHHLVRRAPVRPRLVAARAALPPLPAARLPAGVLRRAARALHGEGRAVRGESADAGDHQVTRADRAGSVQKVRRASNDSGA